MKTLMTTDNKKVGIAIGMEGERYYVQTTDLAEGTELTEAIQENLDSKEHALAIAKLYQDKYGFELFDWTQSKPIGTPLQQRMLDVINEWDKDRLINELGSFILETPGEKLEGLFFDDLATEEEALEGNLKRG